MSNNPKILYNKVSLNKKANILIVRVSINIHG